jgi:molybdate transport system regulatory protein
VPLNCSALSKRRDQRPRSTTKNALATIVPMTDFCHPRQLTADGIKGYGVKIVADIAFYRRDLATGGVYPMATTQLSIRIDLETGGQIGPGKIALLEAISKNGSITAAAQSMNMSRMTAWLMVKEINALLIKPAVTTDAGGTGGGGRAILTPAGQKLIQHYHSIEMHIRAAARQEIQAFRRLVRD